MTSSPSLPTALRARFYLWIILCVALIVAQAAWIFSLRGPLLMQRQGLLIAGQAGLVALLLAIMALLASTPRSARKLSRPTSGGLILAGSLLLQSLAVAWLWPALSEDIARYRLDGGMWLGGISPYATSPNDYLRSHGHDALEQAVAHPQLHTIYPPVAEGIFAIARASEKVLLNRLPDGAGSSSSWQEVLAQPDLPRHFLLLRAISAGFAIGSVMVLLKLLSYLNQSPWWAILFAWNPLLTIETGGMGHIDGAGIFFLLLMLLSLFKGRAMLGIVCLVLACGIKPPVVVVLPWVLREIYDRAGAKPLIRAAACFVLLIALSFTPLLHQQGYVGWNQTTRVFTRDWEANGSIYSALRFIIAKGAQEGWELARAKESARLLALFALLVCGLALWERRSGLAAAAYCLPLVSLLMAPVVYPWYLLWVLAIAPLLTVRSWTILVWSGTVVICYRMWTHLAMDGHWKLSRGELLLEYVPVIVVAGVELLLCLRINKSPQLG